jgi:hypothetical protein
VEPADPRISAAQIPALLAAIPSLSARYWEAINGFWEDGTPVPDIRLD